MSTVDKSCNPDAILDCKACHGTGQVNVGSICYGFGALPKFIECMCITYKKLGINPNKPMKEQRYDNKRSKA